MRKVIWRPRAVSRTALFLIAIVALVGIILVETVKKFEKQTNYDQKLAAAELAKAAMERIYNERVRRGPPIDIKLDPARSGMIGILNSPVTSIAGNLVSKQTSVNPNFAGVIVDMLIRAGVKEGDTVAVGCSGSFPALNVCTYAALQTMKVKPIIITSAAASQFGANIPDFLWIDMEGILHHEGIFENRSVATSIGGYEDQGEGLSEEGLKMIQGSIERNDLPEVAGSDFDQSVEQRMTVYRKHAGRQPIKAYVNVGGGTVSTGRSLGKKLFKPGLNLRKPVRARNIDGIMSRFSSEGVAVIHLVQVTDLAKEHDMPVAPETTPEAGESSVFARVEYNQYLVIGVLVVVLLSLYGFIRTDIGFRVLQHSKATKPAGHPEPMV